MGKEKEIKKRILKFAELKFSREGFYRTTMDELAKELKISKKTIYKHFSSKHELLEIVLENIMTNISKRVKDISLSDLNSAEKLYMLSEFITSRINAISEKSLKDLQIYKPEMWEEIEKFRRKTIMKNLDLIVNQGKREGLIIKQPNAIILGIILGSVQTVMQPEFILHNNISMHKAGRITLNIVFNGILTKKGRKLFKNFIERNKNGKN